MERNEVQIPVVKSIPGVSMEQMIVPKRLWDNGWIYNYYCAVLYDKKEKKFTIEDHAKFWRDGLCLKKYTEFPYHGYQTRKEVFDFISRHLENAYKVVLYLNVFEINQRICDSSVFISECFGETQRVGFYCWDGRGMNYYEKDWDDFFEKLIVPAIQKEKKIKFDMFQNVSSFQGEFCCEQIKKKLKKALLNSVKCKYWIHQMGDSQISYSVQVFQEWYSMFEKRISFLESRNLISSYDDMLSLKPDEVKTAYLPEIISHYNFLTRKLIDAIP